MQYDLKPYANKYVAIKFVAEVKRENAGGPLVMQLNEGDQYPEVGGVFHNVIPNAWHKMNGIWAGWLLNDSPYLYLNSWSPSAENAVYEVRDLSVEVIPLDLNSNDMLLDRAGYTTYLARKNSNEKLAKERVSLLDRLNAIIVLNKITKLENVSDAEILELKRPWNISGRASFLHNITKFLHDYATFIKKENPAQLPLADFIAHYYKKVFIARAKSAAESYRKRLLPLPMEIVINPKYLRGMDNADFVDAFRELHAFVIRCYEDIERDPLTWGYPDYETTDGYYCGN